MVYVNTSCQVCDEDGPSLSVDQQLLWLPEPCFVHAVPASSALGLHPCCLHFRHDHVYTAL